MSKLPEVTVTTKDQLSDCCRHLSTCSHIGFDTEFVGEQSYHPRLCLIQIATEEKLYIVDPLAVHDLDDLWDILLDPDRTIIVHAGREEVRLCQLWSRRIPENFFDLQIAAGLVGLHYPLGHGNLVQQLLNSRIRKGETLTEWRDRPLTRDQIQYAFDDVRYLIPLWKKLHQRLEKLDRLEWAQEEFTRLKVVSTESPEAEEKYRRLKGASSLNRQKLAIVRDLYLWREEKAEQLNRPARTVVRDDLLIEIAKRGPTREQDLRVVRGLARRYNAEILDIVKEASSLPREQCPPLIQREQLAPAVNHMSQILSAVLGDWCTREQVAQTLASNSRELKELVKSRNQGKPPPSDLLLTQGWRAEHLLPVLEAMLEGRASLRIADVTSERPFSVDIKDE